MSFTFEINRPAPIGTVVVSIRNPAFGDLSRSARRQAAGETEGGRLFVQDLGTEQRFYEATFENLNRCERRDLDAFFGEELANKRLRKFSMGVEGNKNLAFLVGTGQGWSTGDDLSTGDLVVPATASFGLVRLEQSDVQFAATPRDRYTTSLRFRIYGTPC
jgi:hypothetical protein